MTVLSWFQKSISGSRTTTDFYPWRSTGCVCVVSSAIGGDSRLAGGDTRLSDGGGVRANCSRGNADVSSLCLRHVRRHQNGAVPVERRASRKRAAREGGASGQRERAARVDGASGRRERAAREGGAKLRCADYVQMGRYYWEVEAGRRSVASMLTVTGRSRRTVRELWGRFSRRIFRLSLMIREVGIHCWYTRARGRFPGRTCHDTSFEEIDRSARRRRADVAAGDQGSDGRGCGDGAREASESGLPSLWRSQRGASVVPITRTPRPFSPPPSRPPLSLSPPRTKEATGAGAGTARGKQARAASPLFGALSSAPPSFLSPALPVLFRPPH